MDSEDRDKDKKHMFVPSQGTGKTNKMVSLDIIKTVYICEGIGSKEIAERFNLPEETIEKLIEDNKLEELRKSYMRQGLSELQNVQLTQAQKLLNMENSFKNMRILQLEKILQDFMVYYARHGHFYKLHPVTQEILNDTNGMPLQIKVPNVIAEIKDLKESVSLSEGMKMVLGQIDDIINKPKKKLSVDPNVIDVDNYNDLFKKRKND